MPKRQRQGEGFKPCPVPHCQVERETAAQVFCPAHWAQLSQDEREEIAVLTANEYGSQAHKKAVNAAIEKLSG